MRLFLTLFQFRLLINDQNQWNSETGVSVCCGLPVSHAARHPLFEHKNNQVGVEKSFFAFLSGKFSKMVQQLSKSGAKETPLLKAGHPPAGKLVVCLISSCTVGFSLTIKPKRCCFPRCCSTQTESRADRDVESSVLSDFFLLFLWCTGRYIVILSQETDWLCDLCDHADCIHRATPVQQWLKLLSQAAAESHTVFSPAGASCSHCLMHANFRRANRLSLEAIWQ